MKFLNKKQKNNKGFSLVELIVVIAIMVVLVAVLAPVFTKYIESSRRSTDIQNANNIAESVLADVADGKTMDGTAVPSAVKDWPVEVKGKAFAGDNTLTYVYNAGTNTCAVYVSGDTEKKYNLTEEGSADDGTGAAGYKEAPSV